MQELCGVDASLLGKAGVKPVGVHGHSLQVPTQQLLQLLDARRRDISDRKQLNTHTTVELPDAENRLLATPTAACTACSASATTCVTSDPMAASSSPSYVLQLRT